MTELAKGLQESERSAIVHATDLLTHYSFDLGDRTVSHLTQHWLKDFSASWIRSAVIEALYQGRYKAVSVDQILLLWKRRNQPCYHFNYEFERLVCNRFPKDLRQRSLKVSPVEFDDPQPTSTEAVLIPTPLEVEEPIPEWVALAEQIQREGGNESEVGEISTLEQPDFEDIPDFEDLLEPADSLADVERISTKAEALPEQSASLEGIQTKQFLKEIEGLNLGDTIVETDDPQPPIHQFTPPPSASDFHSKLKAVAEKGGEESS